MSDLVISVFDEEFRAEQVRIDLLKKGRDHLDVFEDAVLLQRTATDHVKLHHFSHLTLGGFIGGGFLGSLPGIMLLNPVLAFCVWRRREQLWEQSPGRCLTLGLGKNS